MRFQLTNRGDRAVIIKIKIFAIVLVSPRIVVAYTIVNTKANKLINYCHDRFCGGISRRNYSSSRRPTPVV